MILLIVLSILIFMLETLPEYYLDPPEAFFIIESICVGFFTVEFIGRISTTPSYKRFVLGLIIYYYIKIYKFGRKLNNIFV